MTMSHMKVELQLAEQANMVNIAIKYFLVNDLL